MSSNPETMFGSGNSSSHNNSHNDSNPLKSDPELLGLLKRLDQVKKYKTFTKWKTKFLDRLETLLYEDGMPFATKATADFTATLQKCVKKLVSVQACMERGDLTEIKKTVKSSLALSEMCNSLETVRVAVQDLIPASSQDEKLRRFTKFHLGAVLIRQGFVQYVTLKQVEDALTVIGTELANVADRQQLELFAAYATQIQRFCDVLADLALYEIMMKCMEFAEAPEEEESSDEEVVMIPIVVEHSATGQSIKLQVDQSETLDNLKLMIANFCGLEPAKQVLTLNDEELTDDAQSLVDAGVVANSKLMVAPLKVPITVRTLDGKTIPLLVDPTEYLTDIKRALQADSQLAPNNQKLFMNGTELADNNKKIGDYKISAGAVLDLEPKAITVHVEGPSGKTHAIEISPHESLQVLREKLTKPTGISAAKQVIKSGDRSEEIPNSSNDVTMKDLGIQNGASLTVEPFRVPVTIHQDDGTSFDILVDPSDYLSDIKRQLEQASGMPAKNQKLYMEGNELDDNNKTADEYGIGAGSVIDLEPKVMKINVETPDGKSYSVEVAPSDTTDELREKIAQRVGIPAEKQKLTFNGTGIPADSDKAVRDLGIQNGSNLEVSLNKIPVTVNTLDGKSFQVMVDPTDKMRNIKKQLEGETGIQSNNQRLFMDGDELDNDDKTAAEYGVQEGSVLDLEPVAFQITVATPDGNTYTVKASPSDTSDTLKEKIASATGMPAAKQLLKFESEEIPTGGQTLKDIGIQDGSNITAEIRCVPVLVNTLDGQQIEVMVNPTSSLGEIKKQLESKSGIPPANQSISMAGCELDDDAKSAEAYGIEAGSLLVLEPKLMTIHVRTPDGATHSVDITPSDTSDDLKEKIAKQTGIQAPRQILQQDGKELPDGATVRRMKLKDGSTLDVDIFRVPVTVNTFDGRQLQIMVDPTDVLGDIKKQLEPEAGIPAANQCISLAGCELDDDGKSAKGHGIEAGSLLVLEPKSMAINVELPDGKTHSINITPSDTSDDLKNKIAKQTGMSAPRQVLKRDGKALPEGATARKMGIKDGSTISVEPFKCQVTVNTMDGKQIQLMIDPTESLGVIKNQLEPESGIPVANQCLSMAGCELSDNGKAAQDYGIEAGSLLVLEPKLLTVNVQMDGASYSLDITPSDTSEDIKDKISNLTGMAAPRQILKQNGKDLPKDASVRKMGIKDGSTITVEPFKIPIAVKLMDGKIIKAMIEPSSKLCDIKDQLAAESGIPGKNQCLKFNDDELADDNKSAVEYGLESGSQLELEPKSFVVHVSLPDGTKQSVELTPADTSDTVKEKVAKQTGILAPRQVIKFQGQPLISDGHTVKELGIRDGSNLVIDIFRVPIKVKTHDGRTLSLKVEPCDTIDSVKIMIEEETSIAPKKQRLKYNDKELSNGVKTCAECGVQEGSVLIVEPSSDPIIFVDIKCGTLFAVDRDEVLNRQALTPLQGNKLDFVEAAKDGATRDKILQSMKESPSLGVATQVVVQKMDIEDITLEEAEKVKSMWGVNLKKREKNKKGEEFIFVDPKTGACGELSRKKCIDSNFITVVASGKGETLAQRETDTMMYDKYVFEIRNIFGIKSAV
ncbi:hypothetical protein MPSEU_001081500 [Mayamaea pseudoterrestris]|nr:hypothetical protein MPSEU_001081500 [Mayamaea pseudoterrestris]